MYNFGLGVRFVPFVAGCSLLSGEAAVCLKLTEVRIPVRVCLRRPAKEVGATGAMAGTALTVLAVILGEFPEAAVKVVEMPIRAESLLPDEDDVDEVA